MLLTDRTIIKGGGIFVISLKEVYKDYFKVGAAVSRKALRQRYDIVLKHFNTITCENEMKLSGVRTPDGGWHTGDAEEIYKFAMENGIEIRGHNFVWHQGTYPELFADLSPEEMIAFISDHIAEMGKRFKNVSCWDVINEAISDDWNEYLRDTFWKQKLGDDYVVTIYDTARRLLPGTKLVYNDYNEYEEPKRRHIIKLVNDLKSRGLIDAVGLQCHLSTANCTEDILWRSFEDFSKLYLPLHVTEIDISLPEMNDPTPLSQMSAGQIEKQASLYGSLFKILREYSGIIESVTTWGVCDDQSWLNHFRFDRECTALLFDKNGKPTESFYRVIQF